MRRLKVVVSAGATIVMVVVATYATSASSLTSSSALKLQPTLNDQYPLNSDMVLVVGKERRPTIVDTGSLYLFVGNDANDVKLGCSKPSAFHYGGGTADFCTTSGPLRAVGVDGSVVPLASKVTFGRAKFTDNFLPPYAIIGLSANLEAKNLAGLTPIADQLHPRALSFQFRNGPQNNGIVQFAPLPADELRGVAKIPLVSPGGLGYGYTAKVARVDFIANDTVRASIRTRSDGVYLEHDGRSTKIAETNLAFFDTGATEPYVPLSGDISLLSGKVPDALIPFSGSEPYDKVQFTFDVGGGDHVVLSSSTVRAYSPGPFLTVPSASDFPADLKQLTSVVGLGTLADYDFQFDFAHGRATTVRFVRR